MNDAVERISLGYTLCIALDIIYNIYLCTLINIYDACTRQYELRINLTL